MPASDRDASAREPYYRDWAAHYDATTLGVTGDVEFYTALARETDGPVVELGVGTGRIAIPAARAGARVLGIDREPAMLAIARERAAAAGVVARLTLVEGDMRSFAVEEPAALVTIPFRAFLHNLTVEDQLATLASCRRALRPGGRLALNVFNPSLPFITRWMAKGPRHWEPFGRAAGEGVEGSEGVEPAQARNEYEPTAQVVRTQVRVRDERGRWRKTHFRLRYVYRYEMEHLLARSGFQVEALFGDFARSPFGEASTEMVWIARPGDGRLSPGGGSKRGL